MHACSNNRGLPEGLDEHSDVRGVRGQRGYWYAKTLRLALPGTECSDIPHDVELLKCSADIFTSTDIRNRMTQVSNQYNVTRCHARLSTNLHLDMRVLH